VASDVSGKIEHVLLLLARPRQFREILGLDDDMTGRAGHLPLAGTFQRLSGILSERLEEDRTHVERLWSIAQTELAGWEINGSVDRRYRGNVNARREGVDSSRLISEVRSVAFSAASACASGSGRPSPVLEALGLNSAQARSSIRIGFGRYTTEQELTDALRAITQSAEQQSSYAE
jgi:cysteine desulfurase